MKKSLNDAARQAYAQRTNKKQEEFAAHVRHVLSPYEVDDIVFWKRSGAIHWFFSVDGNTFCCWDDDKNWYLAVVPDPDVATSLPNWKPGLDANNVADRVLFRSPICKDLGDVGEMLAHFRPHRIPRETVS